MNTIILFWNPEISSMKLDRYQLILNQLFDEGYNWSVYDHRHAHEGDRFFMVLCGKQYNGICMSGHFVSDPYRDHDWSGRGREVYYMDMCPDVAIHPDRCPILGADELQRAIPDFQWTGGHSGRVLPPEQAQRLEEIWEQWLNAHRDMFNIGALRMMW